MRPRVVTMVCLLALSACSEEPEAERAVRRLDPAVAAALNDPLMIDPDLVFQNRGDAAITIETFDELPLLDEESQAF